MPTEYVIHGSGFMSVTGMVRWALACDAETPFNRVAMDRAVKLWALASVVPSLPAEVLMRMVDGEVEVEYRMGEDDQVIVRVEDTLEGMHQSEQHEADLPTLDELGLSLRVMNRLANEGVTVPRLLKLSEGDLMSLPRMGRKAIDEIKQALSSRGLTLRRMR